MPLNCVNLPRWGLKQRVYPIPKRKSPRVNLPRWGLKRVYLRVTAMPELRVNLPRWGLKRRSPKKINRKRYQCKFTPLGFETIT